MNGVVILAHQGGWDEMLMVLGPIALMAGLLRLAKKRVAARQESDAAAARGPNPATRVSPVDGSGGRTKT